MTLDFEYDVFLSYSRKDKGAVQELAVHRESGYGDLELLYQTGLEQEFR